MTAHKTHPSKKFAIPARRMPIYYAIELERRAQDGQWGGAAHDDLHSNSEWIALVSKQLGQASAGTSKASARTAFIKAAALCCAAIESLDRA
jgi:hypothetical protein